MAMTQADKNTLLALYLEANQTGNTDDTVRSLWQLVVGAQSERDAAIKGALSKARLTRQVVLDNFDLEASKTKRDVQEALTKIEGLDQAVAASADTALAAVA